LARKKLGWSARKLSRAAVGPKSESHYTLLSKRNWNAEVGTIEAFIKALVDAGIPEAELRKRAAESDAQESVYEEAVELLVRRGYKLRRAQHVVGWIENEPPMGGRRGAATPERLARIAAAIIDVDREPVGEEATADIAPARQWLPEAQASGGERPSGKPPSTDPLGTKYPKRQRAGRK
jgi:hypothetical protein